MQLSTGLLTLSGVINYDKKTHTLRGYEKDGVTKEPVVRSIKTVMEGLKKEEQDM